MDLKPKIPFLLLVNSADLTFVIAKKCNRKGKRCSFAKGLTGLIWIPLYLTYVLALVCGSLGTVTIITADKFSNSAFKILLGVHKWTLI